MSAIFGALPNLSKPRIFQYLQQSGSTLFKRCVSTSTSSQTATSTEPLSPQENFWDKNKRLNRPMSPHMTIYRFPVPAVLSITHRGTGLALSTLLSGFAISTLALPHGFPHYYTLLSSSHTGTILLFSAKFLLVFPFIFHSTNGLRHLCWDLGKGLKMNEVYNSGYAVLGFAMVLSLLLAAK